MRLKAALLTALVLILVPSAHAQQNALDLVPQDPLGAVYLDNVPALAQQIRTVQQELRLLGVSLRLPPHWRRALGIRRTEHPLDPRVWKRLGIDLSRGLALYNEQLSTPTLIVGVSNNAALLKGIKQILGTRPQRKAPNHYQLIIAGRTLHLILRGGFAFVSPNLHNLRHFKGRLRGDPALRARFAKRLGHAPTLGLYINFARVGQLNPMMAAFSSQVASEQFFGVISTLNDLRVVWHVATQPLLGQLLARLKLAPPDARLVRQALRTMPAHPAMALRLLIPLRNVFGFAQKLMGQERFSAQFRRFREKTGIDPEADVIANLIGDVLLFFEHHVLDGGLVLSLRDPKRTEKLMLTLLKLAQKELPSLRYATRQEKLGRLYAVRVRIGNRHRSYFTLHWGLGANHLIIAPTELQLRRLLHRLATRSNSPFSVNVFRDTGSLIAYYGNQINRLLQVYNDMARYLRGVITPISAGPKTILHGAALIGYFFDRQGEITLSFTVKGNTLLAAWRTALLPVKSGPLPQNVQLSDTEQCLSSDVESAYFRALQYRYFSREHLSNRCLLQLMRRFPKTPHAVKARKFLRLD